MNKRGRITIKSHSRVDKAYNNYAVVHYKHSQGPHAGECLHKIKYSGPGPTATSQLVSKIVVISHLSQQANSGLATNPS